MNYTPFYTITDWQNLPYKHTPLNRKNLLHLENGVKEADNRIVQLDSSKLSMEIANLLVKTVNVDTETGVITVEKLNGTIETYDLDIERVVANFDVTDDGIIILTLADGTEKRVDIAKFINTFKSSATISFKLTDRLVSATIIDGSVTMKKLDPTIQTQFRQYMLDAQSARDSALQYQKAAKCYTIGDADVAGSETDNAKYYYNEAKSAMQDAKAAKESAQSSEVASSAYEMRAKEAAESAESSKVTVESAKAAAAESASHADAMRYETKNYFEMAQNIRDDIVQKQDHIVQLYNAIQDDLSTLYINQGNYSSKKTYSKNDMVFYNGSTWVATIDGISGNSPGTGNYWQCIAKGIPTKLIDVTLEASAWTYDGEFNCYMQEVSNSSFQSSKRYEMLYGLRADSYPNMNVETIKSYAKAFAIVNSGFAYIKDGIGRFCTYKIPAIDILVLLREMD